MPSDLVAHGEQRMRGQNKTRKRSRCPAKKASSHTLKSQRAKNEVTTLREQLEKEREIFFPILHKAPYGIVLIDKEGEFLYINPEFTHITGYTLQDIHSRRDWFHQTTVFAKYSQEILNTWKKTVLKQGLERTLPVVCKEGEIKHVEFKPTFLDDGTMIVMLSDVTERKKSEEELRKYRDHLEELVAQRTAELRHINEQLQREVTERKRVEEEIKRLNEDLTRRAKELEATNKELEAFSYSVSHDLRSPLIGLQGFSRRLLTKYGEQLDAKGRSLLSMIQRDSQRMLQLVDNLMALSRFEHQDIRPSNINMEEMTRTVFEELKQISFDSPDVPIQLNIEPLPQAYGDPTMVRQVLFNLLSNAIKFSKNKENPLIEIGYLPGEVQHTYFVKDNGVGFDMKHAHRLFGVFERLHSSREFEGTGIGLAIVQRVIQRQGGKVWAEGEIDKGATFYFTLPKGQ